MILTCVRHQGQSAPTSTLKSPRGSTAGPLLSQSVTRRHLGVLPFIPLMAHAVARTDSSYVLPGLARPLRLLWIMPTSARFSYVAQDGSLSLPVIRVSASCAVDPGPSAAWGDFRMQGPGDDHELWGQVRDHLMTKMRAIDDSTNRETTYRPYGIAGPDATAVLEASRRIARVLPRGARCGRRQAGTDRARNGTEGSCSWQRRTGGCRMEHATDACTKGWRSRAAVHPGRLAKTTRASRRTPHKRSRQRRGNGVHCRAGAVEHLAPSRYQ